MTQKWKNSWKSPEYNTWMHMIHRCHNEKDKSYKNYGRLGVTVCQRWRDSFDDFFSDMGARPRFEFSIDRIDPTKGYYLENCRWATKIEQANNKRKNKRVQVDGNMMTAREISDLSGISYKTIRSRIYSGMTGQRLMSKSKHNRESWEHGTLYGYVGMRCRCDLCKATASEYKAAQYRQQKLKLNPKEKA